MAFVNILTIPGLAIQIIDRLTSMASTKVSYDATTFFTTSDFRDDGNTSDVLVLFSSPLLVTDPARTDDNLRIEGVSGTFPEQSAIPIWGGFRGIFAFTNVDPDEDVQATTPFVAYADTIAGSPQFQGATEVDGLADLSGLGGMGIPPFGLRFYKNENSYNPNGPMSLVVRLLVEVDAAPPPAGGFWTNLRNTHQIVD